MKKTAREPRAKGRRGPVAATAEDGEFIKEFRDSKGWTREHLAKLLSLNVRTIYDWEAGKYSPSLEVYSQILKFIGADDWKHTKHCVSKLIDDRTYAQMLEREKELPSTEIAIDSLDDSAEQIRFPRSLFRNPERVRFIRFWREDEGYFRANDLVLVDIYQRSLSTIEDGEFIAVSAPFIDHSGGKTVQGKRRLIGRLRKQDAGFGTSHLFLHLHMPHGDSSYFLGSSTSGRDVIHDHLKILGRVVGWLSQEQPAKHSESDETLG